jgi:S-formylglutathione hydrolase
MNKLKAHKSFGGETAFWSHDSELTGTSMKFSTFIPEGEVKGCVIWLSGLTCTEENFITKAGAQKYLAEQGLMVICPDTSPRGLNLPGEHDSYDFGSGASFYIDAKTPGYEKHYKMESYIACELYHLIVNEFKMKKISIMGHSMGGHGAITLGLKYPKQFSSISAFSPIVHPTKVPWGKKAFSGYLGSDENEWKKHDATELIESGKTHPRTILIHQGTADEFLTKELLTEDIRTGSQELDIRYAEGYDHSYYFIATFIEEHIKHHAQFV